MPSKQMNYFFDEHPLMIVLMTRPEINAEKAAATQAASQGKDGGSEICEGWDEKPEGGFEEEAEGDEAEQPVGNQPLDSTVEQVCQVWS